ncbi:uncharacterized protein [Macaca nemestrina]|uniref:uncharacterized protein n=1 Tax=Macaca nemestrina TaxID=9545 RepID=UPI0039B955B8
MHQKVCEWGFNRVFHRVAPATSAPVLYEKQAESNSPLENTPLPSTVARVSRLAATRSELPAVVMSLVDLRLLALIQHPSKHSLRTHCVPAPTFLELGGGDRDSEQTYRLRWWEGLCAPGCLHERLWQGGCTPGCLREGLWWLRPGFSARGALVATSRVLCTRGSGRAAAPRVVCARGSGGYVPGCLHEGLWWLRPGFSARGALAGRLHPGLSAQGALAATSRVLCTRGSGRAAAPRVVCARGSGGYVPGCLHEGLWHLGSGRAAAPRVVCVRGSGGCTPGCLHEGLWRLHPGLSARGALVAAPRVVCTRGSGG